MNGEVYHICMLVIEVKKALRGQGPIQYTPMPYEGRMGFSLPEGQGAARELAGWFDWLKQQGLREIKFIGPVTAQQRQWLGFSNASISGLLCFMEGGKMLIFRPRWEFIAPQKQWQIMYYGQEWQGEPVEPPRFADNTQEFCQALAAIEDLAQRIDCTFFAAIFGRARQVLTGEQPPAGHYLLDLPPVNLRLFAAAKLADVFGAMGSWNDDPCGMAQAQGLKEEYEKCSDRLLKEMRLALLYAINEW